MIDAADKDWVKANTAEIIGLTGETLLRKRLDTSEPLPASHDADYGEVVDTTEEVFTDLELVGKVFWQPSEKMLVTEFGGIIDAAAVVHTAIADDVVVGDFFIIRGAWYEVFEAKEAPLQGFRALAVRPSRERGEPAN